MFGALLCVMLAAPSLSGPLRLRQKTIIVVSSPCSEAVAPTRATLLVEKEGTISADTRTFPPFAIWHGFCSLVLFHPYSFFFASPHVSTRAPPLTLNFFIIIHSSLSLPTNEYDDAPITATPQYDTPSLRLSPPLPTSACSHGGAASGHSFLKGTGLGRETTLLAHHIQRHEAEQKGLPSY